MLHRAEIEEFARQEIIFHAALQLSTAAARSAYLDLACGEDVALRQRLETLISLEADEALLDTPALLPVSALLETNASTSPAEPEELPLVRIDRYRVLEKLGEGGCGIVYRAEQEKPVRRSVALKILKAGMDTNSVIGRFEAERQALALMDHPNIAKVFDAGSTDTGRPYFVMELVDGVKITDYCHEHQLSTGDRVDLFLQVCDAVQHAHQKGIIHRDLKPSNILVFLRNDAPTAQVIDFGIAKAIEGRLTDQTVHTGLHQFIGTPAYMSPEQAQMSPDIDTRTDIYSLGVLFYELLTGKPPFDNHELLTAGLDEMRRIIRDVEPKRPSHLALTTNHLSLPGDLDWIVMKCLEKDRSRRYETASALAADLQRYLASEPITARPPTVAYRLRKAIGRNKLAFSAAGLIALALLAGIFATSWQAIRASRAEAAERAETLKARTLAEEATKQTRIAEEVKEFLFDNLLGVNAALSVQDPNAQEHQATRLLIEKAARKLEGRFTNEPLTEAGLRMKLYTAFESVRDMQQAKTQAEKAHAIYTTLLGVGHSNIFQSTAALAIAKFQVGERIEAFRLLTDALPLARPAPGNLRPGADGLVGTYALLLRMEGRAAESIPYAEDAVARAKLDYGPTHPFVWQALGDLAWSLQEAGQTKDAERLKRELVDVHEAKYGPTNQLTVGARFDLARLLMQEKQVAEALPMLEEIVALNRQQLGPEEWFTLDAQWWLGWAYELKGDNNRTAALYTEILPLILKFLPNNGAQFLSTEIAEFFVRQKQFTQAKAAFSSIYKAMRKRPPEGNLVFQRLLRASAAGEGWSAAAQFFSANIDCMPQSAVAWLEKAWIFRYVGDDENYRQVVTKALAAAKLFGTNDQHVPIEIAALAKMQFSPEELASLHQRIHDLEAALPSRGRDQQVWGYRAIGHFYFQQSRYTESLEAIGKSELLQSSPDAYTLFLKAACSFPLGEVKKAKSLFLEAAEVSTNALPQPISETENFLQPWEIYQHLVMRRETEALLTGDEGGRSQ